MPISKLPRRLFFLALTLPMLVFAASPEPAPAAPHDLMPAPARLVPASGRLALSRDLTVAIRGHDDARLRAGLARALVRWEARTGFTFARTPEGEFAVRVDRTPVTLVIVAAAPAPALPALHDDESYALTITGTQVVLRAPTVTGVLRGLETLLQCLQSDATGWFLPALAIEDRPRFPWRGLMIDVARHWQPMEVIKRNLDGMALVKLNVLHLHLCDDQGFRIESKTHPELHTRGSDGKFFTQDEMRELIAYAAERGIRVVPEFDIPGHATSWVVSHPELASAPGPYSLERRWGIFDPVLDPTNEATYQLLADVLGEMAALFPDPYFHIGGDENNGKHWSANARIQAFIREKGLGNNEGLHAYFNQRVRALLAPHGKKLVGWDEILHPDLPKDAIIHSWRGAAGLTEAATRGYATILSNGYYIDLCHSAESHYRNDPLPASSKLSPAEQARVLGGEATMWAEWVSPETIDSRIWPRTAAIAERLWSPREVKDLDDMYRRLAIVGRRLEEAGLNHERHRPAMLRRLAGDNATAADLQHLATFIEAIEPVKQYERGAHHPDHTQFTPLTGIADCARPESRVARDFARDLRRMIRAEPARAAVLARDLAAQLTAWREAGDATAAFLENQATAGRASAPVARNLARASEAGLAALAAWQAGEKKDDAWRAPHLAALEKAEQAHDAVELPMLRPLRRLVNLTAPESADAPAR